MSDFRLRPGKPVAQELARVLEAQLGRAQARLKNWAGEPERSFHEARRRLKKARAAARVARAVDEPLARAINDLARDASAALSGPRDADVVLAAAERLAAEAPDATVASALAKFVHYAARAASDAEDRKALAAAALKKIEDARDLARQFDDAEAPAKTLKRAAQRAFRRADRAFIAAHPGSGLGARVAEEIRHEWRKRVKDLWYVERLLAESWPIERGRRERLTNRLGKLLGEERDLLLLAERLRTAARACGGAASRDAALRYVKRKREQILVDAEALGRRIHGAELAPARAAAARSKRSVNRIQTRTAPKRKSPKKRSGRSKSAAAG